jgi:Acyl-CoA reductase (LuxC)
MLGDYLATTTDSEETEQICYQAWADNKWFTAEHVRIALQAISSQMLQTEALTQWAAHYQVPENQPPTQAVGIVMAGNIPLVGFSDWLAVFVSGQRSVVKLSDKDKVLLPWLVNLMGEWMPQSRSYTHFVPEYGRMADFDAVIATGSNQTSRYFHQYFGKYKHIIRSNRNSVAVLTGNETNEELHGLAKDIYLFFGLGCRNVSKIYVPAGYDLEVLVGAINHYPHYADHDKYRNNYDYNTTLYILNKIPYYANHSLVLKEDPAIQSRISNVNYAFYEDTYTLENELLSIKDELQCVVTHAPLSADLPVVAFGLTQSPGLMDYPDGVDVMRWLNA